MRSQRLAAMILAVLASAVLAPVALAPSASAHTSLVSSDPADGSVLQQAPAAVTLTFDEDLLAGANTVSINLADGTVVESRPVEPTGARVTLPWPAGLTDGSYQVAYRVVSDDGHPVTGAITFTVEATGAGPSTTATPTAASPAASESATSSVSESSTAPPSALAMIGLVVAAVVVFIVVVFIVVIVRR